MVLYLKLDQKTWASGDFTSSATYDLSGTIYDDNGFATVRDISGFTGTFRLINQNGDLLFSTTAGITLSANGTFAVAFAAGPYVSGLVYARMLLEVSGSKITAVGVNGSDELFIENN